MTERDNRDDARKAMEAARYGEPGGFKDCKGWLKVFGGLMVFMGLLLLLLAYGVLSEALNPSSTVEGGMPVGVGSAVLFALMFSLPAAVNIVLGWGSIVARRWARALIRIASGTMLLLMLASVGGLLLVLFTVSGGMESSGEELAGMIFGVLLMGVVFVAPNWLVYWFYGREGTIATVERHDPVERWTDKKPLMVIGIALNVGLFTLGGVISIFLPMLMSSEFQMPAVYFGIVIPGFLGQLTSLAIAALTLYYLLFFWKLDPRGWWGLLALAGFSLASFMVTQMVLSPMELMSIGSGADPAAMPMDAAAVQEMESMYQAMTLTTLCMMLAYGWLFWKVRQYFRLGQAGPSTLGGA